MSALAKKMMEKMGWKEGEGLGKERAGVRTYVKVVRRDPHTATGLGHMSDPTQGGSLASTHAVELDSVYTQLNTKKRKRASEDSDDDRSEEVVDGTSTSSTASEARATKAPASRGKGAKQNHRSGDSSSSSSSSSSDDDDDDVPHTGDVTRMSDADLFKRCGGVRLGRAGRHRFFDGKLSRIEKHHGEKDEKQ